MPTMPALKERKKGKTVWATEWDAFAKKVINNFKTISRIQRNICKLHAQQSSPGFLRFTIRAEDDLDPQLLSIPPMLWLQA